MPVRCRIFASLALAAAAAAMAAAQTGSAAKPQDPSTQSVTPQGQPSPTFRTEANFVRVDAYPTAHGQPVLDLRAEDFEILEDGTAQTIQTFEHIIVSPAGPQSQRAEPNSIEQSHQLAANPRNRVFVLFLDTPHVTVEGAWHAREPLIRLIDRVLGPDDLVGVMTPTMSAQDVVLSRKTDVIASGLRNIWPWGERFTLLRDQVEQRYVMCYPTMTQDGGAEESAVAREMIARKRERATLQALHELVLYLRNLREERKAIVTVSEGWLLYKQNESLTRLRTDSMTGSQEPVPGPDPISVGPDGRLGTRNRNSFGGESKSDCDADRLSLSLIDDEQYFREIIGQANPANAAFYTVDPRGLTFFPPYSPERTRLHWLRTLADGTDGIAVLDSNDLDRGMKRISDDLSSYYLLGYYTANARLDGRFHNIKVRVKRPGVDVRARTGYLAATAAEVAAAKKAANPAISDERAAVTSAMSALARLRPDSRFTLNAVPVSAAGSNVVSTLWIAGELQSIPGAPVWIAGGTVDLDVKAGGKTTTSRVTLAPGERAFAVPLTLTAPVDSGGVDVRARAAGPDGAAEPLTDFLHFELPQSLGQPMIYRRGPATGTRLVPAAAFQFSRTERAHLEFAVGADAKAGVARLLDKTGQPMPVPVTVGERIDDRTTQRWITLDITLAPLGAGDYGVDLSLTTASGERKLVTAIRVTR